MRARSTPNNIADTRYIGEREVAEILGLSPRTLQGWRIRKGLGPPWRRLGRDAIRYSLAEVQAWAESQPRGGSPEAA